MADACVLHLVSYNVNCNILLTLLCYLIAVKMDDKPVRVKQENCDNEGQEVEILTRQDFDAEEATTTAAVGVKQEVEGMIKEETEFYEFGDGDEIVKDEDEENAKGTDDKRRSNQKEKKYACVNCHV